MKITFLVVSFVLGLGLFVSVAALAKVQSERDLCQQAQLEKWYEVDNYERCVSYSYDNYITEWNTRCEQLGREDNCKLNDYEMKTVEERYDKATEDCKVYMQ